MKYFDFNIHLPCGLDNLDSRLQDETSMSGSAFEKCFQFYEKELNNHSIGGNIMILNSSLSIPEVESLVSKTKTSWTMTCVTIMVDPREADWEKRITELYDAGVAAIKFHCYIQKISENGELLATEAINHNLAYNLSKGLITITTIGGNVLAFLYMQALLLQTIG